MKLQITGGVRGHADQGESVETVRRGLEVALTDLCENWMKETQYAWVTITADVEDTDAEE